MKSKLFITTLIVALSFSITANAMFPAGKSYKKPETPKVQTTEKPDGNKTLDAPIDNKVYLGLLLGTALLYVGYRRLKKA
jgi:hypothetical protein